MKALSLVAAAATVVGVGLFVLTVGVVQDDAVAGAGGEVQAAAFSLAGIAGHHGHRSRRWSGGEADDGAVDLLAIGGDVGCRLRGCRRG